MNDNGQSFSNTPYKATGNLNTTIGNPNINMNSAVTSNIMEGNPSDSNFGNQQNINSVDFNQNISQSNNLNSNVNPYDTMSQLYNDNSQNSAIEQNPVESFIAKNAMNQPQNFSDVQMENSVFSTSEYNNMNSSVNNYSSFDFNTSDSSSSVRYENAYDTTKKRTTKKTVKIPTEFKTAIFVVLILLVLLSCFDVIYDFFKNFWINL